MGGLFVCLFNKHDEHNDRCSNRRQAETGTNNLLLKLKQPLRETDLVRSGSGPGQRSVEDAARSRHVGQAAQTITVWCIVGDRVPALL